MDARRGGLERSLSRKAEGDIDELRVACRRHLGTASATCADHDIATRASMGTSLVLLLSDMRIVARAA